MYPYEEINNELCPEGSISYRSLNGGKSCVEDVVVRFPMPDLAGATSLWWGYRFHPIPRYLLKQKGKDRESVSLPCLVADVGFKLPPNNGNYAGDG